MIGSSITQTTSRPSSQTLAISNQTSNTLSSKINVVSSDKGKNEKQHGSKKKGKTKKKQNYPPQEKSSDSSSPARKPHYPCLICNEEHFTRDCPHRFEALKILNTSSTSAMLIDPFPNPETHLVATYHASTSQVLMLSTTKPNTDVLVTTRSKYYGNPPSSSNNQTIDQPNTSTSTSSDSIPPPISPELTIKPPKGVVHKSTFNPRAQAAQNYNIVEYLAQSPSTMSMLEVLQNCPFQKHALLSAIGGIDPTNSNLIVFNHAGYMPQLPTQLAFLIQVNALNHLIHQTIVDEGASTCIMSMNF